MPRGVYDRSKAKKKGAAKSEATAVAAPKVKRAYNKRAKAPEAVPMLGAAVERDNDYTTISHLKELAQIRQLGITQVDGLIKKLVNKLETSFDGNNTKAAAVETISAPVAETHSKGNGKVAKATQDIPAPVPFIVPPSEPTSQA